MIDDPRLVRLRELSSTPQTMMYVLTILTKLRRTSMGD